MYAKCGALSKAQEVFKELPARDVVSWSVLICGYVQHGLAHEALKCFAQMWDEGIYPDTTIFAFILKASGSIGAVEIGEVIHVELSKTGVLTKNIAIGSALVDMYAKCGLLAKAQEVFDELPKRDVICWTALVAGYARWGFIYKALKCFGQMQDEGISPNAFTFSCMLKACSSIGAVRLGEDLHGQICNQGLLRKNILLGNTLVDMYAKCGWLEKAQEVLDELPFRDVVSWTALIAGYAEHALDVEAFICFGQMQAEGIYPNAVTYACILKVCSSVGTAEMDEVICSEVRKQCLLGKDVILGNALVDMYAKCGILMKAQIIFDELPVRDVTSWTALTAGYVQHGLNAEALKCFVRMQEEGFSPEPTTFTCILTACGNIGAFKIGEEIHAEVSKQGLLRENIVLAGAVVEMYAKCGLLARAQEVFEELPERDVVLWNVLITGYMELGSVQRVFDSFSKTIGEKIEPNAVTFGVVLTVCTRAGLVEEGQMYYNTMSTIHCIIPSLIHNTLMVDLLSHAGHFDQAIDLIMKMPPAECLVLWMAVLSACRKWLYVELGKQAFDHIVQLDKKYAAAYACMFNTYADAGMQEEADRVEASRVKNKAWKIPGFCWWIDENRNLHSFTVDDKSHPETKLIYAKLREINKKLVLKGHIQHPCLVSQAHSLRLEKDFPFRHIEKLAISCVH